MPQIIFLYFIIAKIWEICAPIWGGKDVESYDSFLCSFFILGWWCRSSEGGICGYLRFLNTFKNENMSRNDSELECSKVYWKVKEKIKEHTEWVGTL